MAWSIWSGRGDSGEAWGDVGDDLCLGGEVVELLRLPVSGGGDVGSEESDLALFLPCWAGVGYSGYQEVVGEVGEVIGVVGDFGGDRRSMESLRS